jgi:pimeloyl-ACP methyl ester carboxylesterase
VIAVAVGIVVLVAAVYAYGSTHKQHSTPEVFAAAQDAVFRAFGASPASRYTTLRSGVRTHYLEMGNGAPLLAIHGGNSMSASWARLAKPLSSRSRLIMVDRPGCGLTDKINYRGVPFREHAVEFTRDFLDAIGVQKTAILGNSMGGYFALAFALAYPDRVTSLILIGAPPMISEHLDPGHRVIGIPGLNRWIYALRATMASFGVSAKPPGFLYAHPEKLTSPEIEAQRAAEALPGAEDSWLTMVEQVTGGGRYASAYNLRNELAPVRPPTLIIIGDRDGIDTTQQVASTMPEARKVIVRDAAHIPWVDDTGTCTRLILDFIRTNEP